MVTEGATPFSASNYPISTGVGWAQPRETVFGSRPPLNVGVRAAPRDDLGQRRRLSLANNVSASSGDSRSTSTARSVSSTSLPAGSAALSTLAPPNKSS